jgi:hypothetical protein
LYKWQTFLGGIASAGILAAGVAAPALAQAAPATNGSPLTAVSQTLGSSPVSRAACQLTGLPMAGEVFSAAGALTMTGSCGSSSQTPDNTLHVTDSQNSTKTPGGLNPSGISSLPGLDTVAGVAPGLNSATSQVPAVGSLTSSGSGPSSPALAPAGVTNGVAAGPARTPGQGTSGSSLVPGSLSGVTGALPVGSLTGGLPNVGGVTGVLSGVTGH